ncbi:MAG: ankyrin repeat domain-containing protein [Endozoicomonadaceae bacterium]|nr:ankyrin repeat domain-containing protein [Endozoicomonadaceae bacterium]
MELNNINKPTWLSSSQLNAESSDSEVIDYTSSFMGKPVTTDSLSTSSIASPDGAIGGRSTGLDCVNTALDSIETLCAKFRIETRDYINPKDVCLYCKSNIGIRETKSKLSNHFIFLIKNICIDVLKQWPNNSDEIILHADQRIFLFNLACQDNNIKLAETVLKIKHANDNFIYFNIACHRASREIINCLVNSEVDFDKQNKFGDTLIHTAAVHGNIVMAEFLLNKGVFIDTLNQHGKTPLHHAFINEHSQLHEYLLTKKANCYISKYTDIDSLFTRACECGNVELVNSLLSRNIPNINAYDIQRCSPIGLACLSGSTEIVGMLLEKGVSINSVDGNLVAPLFKVCIGQNTKIIEYLLMKKADTTIKNHYGETPFHVICRSNHYINAKLLLSHGINPNIKNSQNRTVLSIAMTVDTIYLNDEIKIPPMMPEMLELLLDNGVVVNTPEASNDKSQLYYMTKQILDKNDSFIEEDDSIKKDKKLFHKIVSAAVKTGKTEIYNQAELAFNWWREKEYSIDAINGLLNSPYIIAEEANNLLSLEYLCLLRILTSTSSANGEDAWVTLCENNSVLPRYFKVNFEIVKQSSDQFKLIKNIETFAMNNEVYDLPQISFNFNFQKIPNVVRENSRLNTTST